MRARRLTVTVAALLGLATPVALAATPVQAASCTSPSVVLVEALPGTRAIGVSKEGLVEIYLDVEANGCALSKPSAELTSPGGGHGSWPMEKLEVADGVTTYGVQVAIPPQQLFLDDAGRWDVAAQVKWSGGLVGGESRMSVVRAARLSLNAKPEPVKKGKTITASGVLDRANWETGKYAGFTKQKVALQFKPKGGSYATVKTVTSGKKGAVKATVKATKDGCFRFTFKGISTTGKKTSTPDCVDVT